MKLTQMEYFSQVCYAGSITRAAKDLHLSQPSITAAIHEMEKELGINLFLRRKNKLQLTEEGAFVLERVRAILKNVDNLTRDLKDFTGQKTHIRLGLPLQIGAFLLPILFAKFKAAYPEIKLEIQENGAYDIVKNLMDDQLDMAVLSIDSSRKWDVSWTHLYNSQFCFCVGEGHPLARRESITFEEACQFPVVMFTEGFYVNDRIKDCIQECGVAPEICMETGQLHTIKSMVMHGGCGAFLLQEAVRLDGAIRAVPLNPPLEAEIGLITRRGKVIYDDARALIHFVKKELQKEIAENK